MAIDIADLDGDQDCQGDLIIGAPGEQNGQGVVYWVRMVNGALQTTVLGRGQPGDRFGQSLAYIGRRTAQRTETVVVLGASQVVGYTGTGVAGSATAVFSRPTANQTAALVAPAGRCVDSSRYDFAVAYGEGGNARQSFAEFHSGTDGVFLARAWFQSDRRISAITYVRTSGAVLDEPVVGLIGRPDPLNPPAVGQSAVQRIYYAGGTFSGNVRWTSVPGQPQGQAEFATSLLRYGLAQDLLVGSPGLFSVVPAGGTLEVNAQSGSVVRTIDGDAPTLRSGQALDYVNATPKLCDYPRANPTPAPSIGTPPTGGGGGGGGSLTGPQGGGGGSGILPATQYILDGRTIERFTRVKLHNGYARQEEVAVLDYATLQTVGRIYGDSQEAEFGAAISSSSGLRGPTPPGVVDWVTFVAGSPGADNTAGRIQIYAEAQATGIAVPVAQISGAAAGEQLGQVIAGPFSCPVGTYYCVAAGVPSANGGAGEVRVYGFDATHSRQGATVLNPVPGRSGFGSALNVGWFSTAVGSTDDVVLARDGNIVELRSTGNLNAIRTTLNPPAGLASSTRVTLHVGALPPTGGTRSSLTIGYPDANVAAGGFRYLPNPVSTLPGFTVVGQTAGDELGAAAVYIDGRPQPYVVVGAPGAGQGRGRVDVYGVNGVLFGSVVSPVAGARFGAALGFTNDQTGDSFSELLVGAPNDGPGAVYVVDPTNGVIIARLSTTHPSSGYGATIETERRSWGWRYWVGAPQRAAGASFASGGIYEYISEGGLDVTQEIGYGARNLSLQVTTVPVGGFTGRQVQIDLANAAPNVGVYLGIVAGEELPGMSLAPLDSLFKIYLDPVRTEAMFIGTTDQNGRLVALLPNVLPYWGVVSSFTAQVVTDSGEVSPAVRVILTRW